MSKTIRERFRGYLPVVVDVETGGLDPRKHALLEIGITFILMNEDGKFKTGESFFEHILPFEGAELDPASLAFNQIDPYQPLRFAVNEKEALEKIFHTIRKELKRTQCQRAVLVGHNAWFDLLFLNEAVKRTALKSPFHAFTCFDTATLSGVFYGQTVLAKAAEIAHIAFDPQEAHSAVYDAQKTAELFCKILDCVTL
jgi:ribonuclease T